MVFRETLFGKHRPDNDVLVVIAKLADEGDADAIACENSSSCNFLLHAKLSEVEFRNGRWPHELVKRRSRIRLLDLQRKRQ